MRDIDMSIEMLEDESISGRCAKCAFVQEAKAALAAARQEIEELKAWVSDLHSGMYINCVYCGHRYGPDPGTPVAMAEILRQHVEKCPKHPLSQMRVRAERAEAERDEAVYHKKKETVYSG